MSPFSTFLKGPRFWWAVFILSALSMVVALFYQYWLLEDPCAICIHIRIYMTGLMIVGLVGANLKPLTAKAAWHWMCAVLSVGLALKSWELFGVERGFIEGSCTINAGLPSWFALESWIPSVFEARGICGFSPEMLLGVTMAEALMVVSIAAAMISILAAVVNSVVLFRDCRRVEA